MNIETLITKKKASRQSAGLAVRITFTDRAPFTGYYATEAKRDAAIANATDMIGKFCNGATIKTVNAM